MLIWVQLFTCWWPLCRYIGTHHQHLVFHSYPLPLLITPLLALNSPPILTLCLHWSYLYTYTHNVLYLTPVFLPDTSLTPLSSSLYPSYSVALAPLTVYLLLPPTHPSTHPSLSLSPTFSLLWVIEDVGSIRFSQQWHCSLTASSNGIFIIMSHVCMKHIKPEHT